QTIQAVRDLQAETATAARVLGMLSPWMPSITDVPPGAGARPRPISLANAAGDIRFPFVDDAVDFLLSKNVVTTDQFRVLRDADKAAVFSAPGIDDKKLLNELKLEIATSLESGESLPEFRNRVSASLLPKRHETET